MNANSINPNSPETAKFMEWHKKATACGLVDVKFYPRHVEGATMESFFAEVNTARNAETVNRPEFF